MCSSTCSRRLLPSLAVCAGLVALLVAQGFCADKPAAKKNQAKSSAPSASNSSTSPATKPAAKPAAKKAGKAAKPAEPWDAAKAGKEYRSLGLELALARTGNPYLVMDVGRQEVSIRVKGAVVWNSRLTAMSGDSEALADFAHRFTGGDRRPIRMITSKYLFASREKTPDSILAIVGKVVKADPVLLQRDIPERFELRWGSDLILDVRTEIVGVPKSKFKNTEVSVIEAIRKPFGLYRLKIMLPADDALTLYRAAEPGLPTLVLLAD